MKNWVVAVVVMVIGLAVAATAFFNIESVVHVVEGGDSMRQQIREKDGLTVVAVPEVHRGDIVLFDTRAWPAAKDHGALVKRVVGVGGDNVAAGGGKLGVNGRAITEDYVYKDEMPDRFANFSAKVPEGRVFVAGDWRANSVDSRLYADRPGQGTIPTDDIVGVVIEVNGKPITPTNAFTNAGLPGAAGALEPSKWPLIGGAGGLAVFIAGLIWLVMLVTRRPTVIADLVEEPALRVD